MPLTLVTDSTTGIASEGILGEHKHPQPLADASGYNVTAIGLKRSRPPDASLAMRSIIEERI
ncbi:MAG: hypothetical protein NTX48_17865 [Planctomycetales bacterium]|nr:hypothetical protein [Planctomycetales bacterium]